MARLTRQETEALADALTALLDQIQASDLTASRATIHRIEGAIAGLRASLGELDDVKDRLLGTEAL